jgi:hypothetical protein
MINLRMKAMAAVAIVGLVPVASALQWTSTEAVLRPQADGAMPVASYGFRNETGAAVTITQAVPSCDCTTVDLVAKTYAPGEKGTLVARFDPTGRSGIVKRPIAVSTDEQGSQPQVLTLTAELPEVITLTPHDLRWAAGEPPVAKTVDVLVNAPEGLELTAAWANHPDFKVEFITVTARSHYRVKVTPPGRETPGTELPQNAAATSRAAQAVILLKAAGGVPLGTNLTFYARVR